MKKYIGLFLLCCFGCGDGPQPPAVPDCGLGVWEFEFAEAPERFSAVLWGVYGDALLPLDTLAFRQGRAAWSAPDAYAGGLCQLTDTSGRSLLFFADTALQIRTHYRHWLDSARSACSPENSLFFAYLQQGAAIVEKTALVEQVGGVYLPTDPFYKAAARELEQLNGSYEAIRERAAQQNKLLSARYILAMYRPLIPHMALNPAEKQQQRLAYLSGMQFNEPELLHTDAYTAAALQWLNAHRRPELSKPEQALLFRQAADSLMQMAGNQDVRGFMAGYLAQGFAQFGYPEIAAYLGEQYAEDIACGLDALPLAWRKALQGNMAKPGESLPVLSLRSSSGAVLGTAELAGAQSLFIFWSINCPHCHTLLQQLSARPLSNYTVVLICIDAEPEAWKGLPALKAVNWPMYSLDLVNTVPEAWGQWGIQATPTMVLTDANHQLLERRLPPFSLEKP